MDIAPTLIQDFDKGNFLEVIDKTKDSTAPEELVLRVSSFMMLNRYQEALECLLKNRPLLFAFNPAKCIETNIQLRVASHQYDEALADVEYYRNANYVSQEIEELIAKLPKVIRDAERYELIGGKTNAESMNTIMENARVSDDQNFILLALTKLAANPKEIPFYINDYLYFLKGDTREDVKSFALMLLKMSNFDKEVRFTKHGKNYGTIPSYLDLPFMDERYQEMVRSLNEYKEDQTIARVSTGLFTDYVLRIYPDDWCKKGEEDKFRVALFSIAADYTGQAFDTSPYQMEEILGLKLQIKSIIERKVQ